MIRADFSSRVPSNYRLYLLSCTHFGNAAMSMPSIKRAIKLIDSDSSAYWGHLGDVTESIHVGDFRYDPVVHAGKYQSADQQAEYFADTFAPIADKCLFILRGNHEEKIIKTIEVDRLITDRFRDYHGVKENIVRGGRTIKATFSDDFKLYATHGAGSVNSQAGDRRQMENNDAIKVKRKLRLLQSDCIVMAMAHIHKVRVCSPVEQLHIIGDTKTVAVYPKIARTPEGVIPEDYRWYCSTGAFLKTLVDGMTTYSEAAMYSPTEIGCIRIDVTKGQVTDVAKVIF